MNIAHFPAQHRATPGELDTVRLRVDVVTDGITIPAGAEGVVVAVYGDGKACKVEFVEPVHAVVTVEHSQVA
ncbi:DUF4926 domain-containing protein [Sandarakinorhabdus oryzae]|uniref:DUF4926 domain-containing protein n=1 Tax=Sandarakinorhabdus oryzae TaxID=2675220 RepID=UPI0012E31DED|nr:DUF4926 domain-containing protein [Sandarakinorhabdus oryzae]